jgi:hypothetical protein
LAALALGALVGLSAGGCESQPAFADCALDEEVTSKGICSGDGGLGTGTTSCVVTKHPHCTEGVCASHFGSKAFCTRTCQSDADCAANGAFCWAFTETDRYCVPNRLKNE